MKYNFKVGDEVRKVSNDSHDCSTHKIGDKFIVEEIVDPNHHMFLRSTKGRSTGIPAKCCELVTSAINNNYSIY